MREWERDAQGRVMLAPLTEHEVQQTSLLVLLRLARVTGKAGTPPEPFQVAMTTAQARALAIDLLQTVQRMDLFPDVGK